MGRESRLTWWETVFKGSNLPGKRGRGHSNYSSPGWVTYSALGTALEVGPRALNSDGSTKGLPRLNLILQLRRRVHPPAWGGQFPPKGGQGLPARGSGEASQGCGGTRARTEASPRSWGAAAPAWLVAPSFLASMRPRVAFTAGVQLLPSGGSQSPRTPPRWGGRVAKSTGRQERGTQDSPPFRGPQGVSGKHVPQLLDRRTLAGADILLGDGAHKRPVLQQAPLCGEREGGRGQGHRVRVPFPPQSARGASSTGRASREGRRVEVARDLTTPPGLALGSAPTLSPPFPSQ